VYGRCPDNLRQIRSGVNSFRQADEVKALAASGEAFDGMHVLTRRLGPWPWLGLPRLPAGAGSKPSGASGGRQERGNLEQRKLLVGEPASPGGELFGHLEAK